MNNLSRTSQVPTSGHRCCRLRGAAWATIMLLTAACASSPQPEIGPFHRVAVVPAESVTVKTRAAESTSDHAIKGTVAGGTVGAIDGAIWGDVNTGAARGALWGGTISGLDADQTRQMVFKRCLAGRGYKVLN